MPLLVFLIWQTQGKKTKGAHRVKQEFGYKGARSLEEEWGILVKEVYEDVKDDPRTDPESLFRLKDEYSQLSESIEVKQAV